MTSRETATRTTRRARFENEDILMTHLYIADCSPYPAGGIFHYIMDSDGALSPIGKTPADRPMYLAFDGDTLYALLRAPFAENESSGVCAFPIGADGALGAASDIVPTEGAVGCHLCAAFGAVYAANYLSGSVIRLPQDGTDSRLVVHHGAGADPARQDMAHPHYIAPTPDGRYLVCADLGMDTIFTYDPALHEVSRLSMPVGCGCRHLVFSEDGAFAYCVNELSSTLSALSYANGNFAYLGSVPLDGGMPSAVRYRSGRVYAASRTDSRISVFEADGGRLAYLYSMPTGGVSPRDFALFGGFAVCANERGGAYGMRVGEGARPAPIPGRFEKAFCVVGRPCGAS